MESHRHSGVWSRGQASALMLCLAVAAGCGRSDPSGVDASVVRPRDVPVFDTHLIGAKDQRPPRSLVTVLDPGREPRVRLRYQPAVGSRQRLRLRSDTSIDLEVSGHRLFRRDVPPTDTVFDLVIKGRAADGSFDAQMIIDHTQAINWEGINPKAGADLRSSYEALRGLVVPIHIGARGQIDLADLRLPDAVTRERAQVLDLIRSAAAEIVLLPDEPVGVGARWRSERQLEPGQGTGASRVSEVKVVSLAGGHVELRGDLHVNIEPQPLIIGPDGVMWIERTTSTGMENVALDLSRIGALSMDSSTEIAIEMQMSMHGTRPVHQTLSQRGQLTTERP